MYSDPTMGLGMGMGDCGCGSAPMMQPQVMLQPQQFTTYVEVPRTVMRQEAVQVQVPTTTYQPVAVDEGGYQQVWVPRMVTKNVPQTVMQTQVQYRQVPQTVVERVPQMSTQWIPSQTVMGVPTIAPGSAYRPTYAMGTPSYPIATPTTVTPVPEYNSPAPFNRVPTPVVPQTSQVQEWQKVRQRSSTIEQQNFETEVETSAAVAAVEAPPAGYLVPKAVGRFSSKR